MSDHSQCHEIFCNANTQERPRGGEMCSCSGWVLRLMQENAQLRLLLEGGGTLEPILSQKTEPMKAKEV